MLKIRCLILLLFLCCTNTIAAQDRTIAIVKSQSALSQKVSETIKEHLSSDLPTPHVFDADNPFLKGNLTSLRPKLILSIGSRSLSKLISEKIETPILSIFIPRASYNNILSQSDYSPTVSVIYLDQPYVRQLTFCKLLFPKKSKMGILFGPYSQARKPEIEQESKLLGIKLVSHIMANDNELKVAMNKIIKASDYLLLIADDRVVTHPNNAKFILQYAYVSRIPVIGFSNSFVSAGGTAAIYSTPAQIGKQTAEIVNSSLKANRVRRLGRVVLPEPQFPFYFTVKINTHAAYLLGVNGDEKAIHRELNSQ